MPVFPCRAVMEISSPEQITERLIAWSNGDEEALQELIPAVYQELHRMASVYLRQERTQHTLQPTALIHEAYLRLIDQSQVRWQNRAHFFGVAAQMMRRILTDYAKAKHRDKRGGKAQRLPLDEAMDLAQECASEEVIAVGEALERLAVLEPRKSRVVEMRYFGGLTVAETAEVLGVSQQTIVRDWNLAKAWLYQELRRGKVDAA